jgi:hypothetical protein
MYGEITRRGIGHYLEEPKQGFLDNASDLIPHAAGLAAVATVNGIAIAFGIYGGAYGKAVGLALLAIPDPVIYLIAYNLTD